MHIVAGYIFDMEGRVSFFYSFKSLTIIPMNYCQHIREYRINSYLTVLSEQAVTITYGAKHAGYMEAELRCPPAGEACTTSTPSGRGNS